MRRDRTIILFSLVALGVIMSQFATSALAETAGQLYDECPCWVKASSDPKLTVSMRLDNNSLGSDWASSVNWLNMTFTNVTLFNASVDLAALTSDSSSGVAICNETDGTPGFSSGDTVVGTPGAWFKESDTIWRLNVTFTSGQLTIPKTASAKNIYIVIRTSGAVSNGDQWKVGLGANQLNATYGSYPSSAFDSSNVTADTVAPQSSVDSISPYWRNASPYTVTATASDPVSGVENVTLWYRFSAGNTSWGSWIQFGTDVSAPWSWSFDWPSGQGHYEFYSVSLDKVGNAEPAPSSRDAIAGFDTGSPTSYAEALPFYETVSTFTVTGEADDSLSGMWEVDLYYAKDGGSWTLYGTDTTAPWSWAFDTSTTGGDGDYQFYTRARDSADNYETAPSGNDTTAVVDTVAPDTQYSPSGTVGQNGWYTSSVTVTLNASDGTSGVAVTLYSLDGGSWTTYTAPFTVSGDLAHSLCYFSEDEAGNAEAQKPASVRIDATPPIGTAGAQPSYRNARTFDVAWSASDVTSGVALVRLHYSTDGGMTWSQFGTGFTLSPIIFTAGSDATYRFNIQTFDIAGNSEPSPSGAGSIEAATIVDTSPPVTTDNAPAGWSTASVNIVFNPSGLPVCATYHSLDGDPWINSTSMQITTDGIHTAAYYSVDCAGNEEAQKSVNVQLDATTPSGIAGAQPNFRNVRIFDITWSGSDATSGLASVRLYFSTNGGVTWNLYGSGYTSSPMIFTATTDANFRFNIRAYDVAGNSEPAPSGMISIEANCTVDTVGPETSPSLAGTLGLNGWYVAAVDVTLSRSDPAPGSGVAATWYRVDSGPWAGYAGPFSLSLEGEHLVTYYSRDNAGNAEVQKTLAVMIDSTAPTSNATALQIFTNTRTITLCYSAGDATSGISRVELWVKAPSAAWTLHSNLTSSPTTYIASADGEHQFRTIAADMAGNREESAPPIANDTFTWIDTVDPFTQAIPDIPMGLYEWYLQPVNVFLEASDYTSGVAMTLYSRDGESWHLYTGVCTLAKDGIRTLAYRSVDRAGNEEPQSVLIFKIDQTTPSGNADPQPAYRKAHAFDLAWSASDATSGLDHVRLYYSVDGGSTWSEFGSGFTSSPITFTATTDGSFRFNIRAYDVAGNSEPAPSGAGSIEASTFVDIVPPQTTHSLSGTIGLNGWYTTGVLVTLAVNDPAPGSGPALTWYRLDGGNLEWYSAPISVTGEGQHTFSYYSDDNAGNIEIMNTFAFKIDSSSPASAAYPLPQFVSDRAIAVHFNATDAVSGVAAVELWVIPPGAPSWILQGTFTASPAVFTASVDGLYQFSLVAADSAGIREGDVPTAVKAQTTLDTVMPDTTNDLSGTQGLNGWYTSDVTVSLTATDGSSGVAAILYSVDGMSWIAYGAPLILSGEGVHDVMYYSVDNAGNAELQKAVRVGIDETAPTAAPSFSGLQGLNGWFRSAVTVAITASDQTSGVSEILFGVDTACAAPYSMPFAVSGEGLHAVNYCSVDIAGNPMQDSVTVRIDTVAPVTLLEFTGNQAVNGWQSAAVTASITAADVTSGLSMILYSIDCSGWTAYTGTFQVGGEGAHVVSYYGVDTAGGSEAVKSSAVKIDSEKPVSAAVPLQSDSPRTFDVFFTAYDNISGISSVELWYRAEGSVAFIRHGTFTSSPIRFTAASDGFHEFYTIAKDVAGNVEDIKQASEAITEVKAGADPVTTQDFENAIKDLRSALDLAVMTLILFTLIAVILAAVGIRMTVKSRRTLARRLETIRPAVEPHAPKAPSTLPEEKSVDVEENDGMKDDFEESIEDELDTEEVDGR